MAPSMERTDTIYGGLVPLFVPEATQEDRTDITVDQALDADVSALNQLIRRYQADSVIVAVLHHVTMHDKLRQIKFSFTRYEADTLLTYRHTVILNETSDNPEGQLLNTAAAQIISTINENWKQESLQGDGAEAYIKVTVPIESFNAWLKTIELLKNAPNLIDYQIHSLNPGRAELNLHYRGDRVRFQKSLSFLGLQLHRPRADWYVGMVRPEATGSRQDQSDRPIATRPVRDP